MYGKMVILLVATCCLLGVTTARGQANINENQETATIYVDVVNGNDHNNGSQGAPFKTIQKAVNVAESNNLNGVGTHVYINPGLYRENILLRGTGQDTTLPETFEAATPGTVVITGADQYTNWTQYSGNSSVYSTPWTFNFGLCPRLIGQAPREPDIHLRQEMAIINGVPLQQVLFMDEMMEGTFYVDDSGQQLYIWPPSGTDLSNADVELGDRGHLWVITNKNGVVLRGLTFEYSADCVSNGAVQVDFGPNQNIEFDTDNFFWNNATGLHLFSPLTNYTVQNVVANHNGNVGIETFQVSNGLWQNNTADFNNWRGEQASYYGWGATGINIYSDWQDTFTNIVADWNVATGLHWDTFNQNTSATNIFTRNNFFDGVLLERDSGPMTLAQVTSCNNANTVLQAGGLPTTAGGLTFRDSENINFSNSVLYGNGNGQINIVGVAGGILIQNPITGQYFTVMTQAITNTNNVIESTNATQSVLHDSYLNGSDWQLFQSTLSSENNTWWAPDNSLAYILPVPQLDSATDLLGWQTATLQDLTSTFAQPSGNPESQCPSKPDMPDWWLVTDTPSLTLDNTGNGTSVYSVVPLDGFTGTVSLSVAGINQIPGLSASITPTTISNGAGTAVFSATASTSIQPGVHQFTVLANSGSTTRTTTAFLIVPITSVRLSTLSLNFPNQQVNTTSAPLTVMLSNVGNSALNVTSIVSSNPVFAESDNCGSSLGAGQSCTISVTFTPKSPITTTATLTFTDSDPTSPQVVSLSGTGTPAGVLTLSTYFVPFGGQVYETISTVQTVTATNTGVVPVTFSGASFTGPNPNDFLEMTTCGQELDPGNTCQINFKFTPEALGNLTASFVINDNTAGGMTTIAVAGYGLTGVSVSPSFLAFGYQEISMASAPQIVTLTNSGGTALAINSITFLGQNPGDFMQTNTCGSSVQANGSCTISVVFDPQGLGGRLAMLQIDDSDPTSPQTVTAAGTGTN